MSRGFLLSMGTCLSLLARGHTRWRRYHMFDPIDAAQRILLQLPDDVLGHLAVCRSALRLKQNLGVPGYQFSPQVLIQTPRIAHDAPVLLGRLVADAQRFAEDLEVLGTLGSVGPRVVLCLQRQPVVHATRPAVRGLRV